MNGGERGRVWRNVALLQSKTGYSPELKPSILNNQNSNRDSSFNPEEMYHILHRDLNLRCDNFTSMLTSHRDGYPYFLFFLFPRYYSLSGKLQDRIRSLNKNKICCRRQRYRQRVISRGLARIQKFRLVLKLTELPTLNQYCIYFKLKRRDSMKIGRYCLC